MAFMVLGPMLDDEEPSVRFAAVDALLGLTPDDIGVYFGPLQEALAQYQQTLSARSEYPQDQVHLARLYMHERDFDSAHAALALRAVTRHNIQHAFMALLLHFSLQSTICAAGELRKC